MSDAIQTKLEIICLLDPRLDGCEVFVDAMKQAQIHHIKDGWVLFIAASEHDQARDLWNKVTAALGDDEG